MHFLAFYRSLITARVKDKCCKLIIELVEKTCRDSGELMKHHGGSRTGGGSRT